MWQIGRNRGSRVGKWWRVFGEGVAGRAEDEAGRWRVGYSARVHEVLSLPGWSSIGCSRVAVFQTPQKGVMG